LVLEVQVE
jgi:hypothetical protein